MKNYESFIEPKCYSVSDLAFEISNLSDYDLELFFGELFSYADLEEIVNGMLKNQGWNMIYNELYKNIQVLIEKSKEEENKYIYLNEEGAELLEGFYSGRISAFEQILDLLESM